MPPVPIDRFRLLQIETQLEQARALLEQAHALSRAGVSSAAIAAELGVYLAAPQVMGTHTLEDLRAACGAGKDAVICVVCGRPF